MKSGRKEYTVVLDDPLQPLDLGGKWKILSSQMPPGSSVIVDSEAECAGLRLAFKLEGHRMRRRAIYDDHGISTGQYKVWKLK